MATPIEILRKQAESARTRADGIRITIRQYEVYVAEFKTDLAKEEQQAVDCDAAAGHLENTNG
jgi:hypothetical protein